MGWNSNNHFQERIDDKTMHEVADAIVATGKRDAGYVYVNIDDTWEGERDAQDPIHPMEARSQLRHRPTRKGQLSYCRRLRPVRQSPERR
jgi:hypothetical protein